MCDYFFVDYFDLLIMHIYDYKINDEDGDDDYHEDGDDDNSEGGEDNG